MSPVVILEIVNICSTVLKKIGILINSGCHFSLLLILVESKVKF